MKRHITLIALFTLGFSQITLASQGLVGTWKQYKTECKSGATIQPFTGGFSGSPPSIQVSFTKTDIKVSIIFNLKYDGSQSEVALKQIEESKKQVEQMPDSPEKRKYLADLEKIKADLIVTLNKYKDGVSCELQSAGSYSISGSELSTKMSMIKSNCEGPTSDDQDSKSQFEVQGNTLIITAQPEKEDGMACPKGDSQVSFFSRNQ